LLRDIHISKGSLEEVTRNVSASTTPTSDSQPDPSRPRLSVNQNGGPPGPHLLGVGGVMPRAKPKLLYQMIAVGAGVGEIRDPLCVGCLLNGEIVVTEWTNKRLQV